MSVCISAAGPILPELGKNFKNCLRLWIGQHGGLVCFSGGNFQNTESAATSLTTSAFVPLRSAEETQRRRGDTRGHDQNRNHLNCGVTPIKCLCLCKQQGHALKLSKRLVVCVCGGGADAADTTCSALLDCMNKHQRYNNSRVRNTCLSRRERERSEQQ